jgi:hypothetical protein
MADDQYAGIVTVSPDLPPEAPTAPTPEASPQPAPWEAKLAQLERLTQQLQMDNAALKATVETTQRLRPEPPAAPPEPQGPPARPQLADFTDQAAYDQAMETWLDQRVAHNTRQTLQEAEQQRSRQAQEAELARTQAESDARLLASEAAKLREVPDYNQRAQQVAAQMHPATYWAVRATGEAAPDLVLHLDAHPEVLQRLNQTQPHLLGLEVGRLLAQVVPPAPASSEGTVEASPPTTPPAPAMSAPPASRPPPPAPPQTVTGGGVVPPTGLHADMTQAQYEQERRRQNPRLFRR